MLTTATDLLFTGGREGHFQALDARTGKLLWKTSLGGQIVMAPITFAVDGKQYVSIISGGPTTTAAARSRRRRGDRSQHRPGTAGRPASPRRRGHRHASRDGTCTRARRDAVTVEAVSRTRGTSPGSVPPATRGA